MKTCTCVISQAYETVSNRRLIMNWNNIATVYLKELKDSLRDRRTLLSMIIIPTLVMPALIFGLGKIASNVVTKARGETPRVMILGGEDSPTIVAALKASAKLEVVPPSEDWKAQISEKKIRGAVQLPNGFEAALRNGVAEPVVLFHYEGELKSGFAINELDRFFRELRERTVAARLTERSLPATFIKPFEFVGRMSRRLRRLEGISSAASFRTSSSSCVSRARCIRPWT